ncbi:DUF6252 family protein [Flavobacterium sp. MK4S-17]|uniref:DUF6252 family protein n=1 Tax=Flavobacterium sp. MK4S-17 TaxID=2543737 RepID=UPI00135CCB87|nr:DUF6252 family protein [Flavobacterium sp. MK4S-17]
MRKFISLLVLLIAITSCEEDVKFNNPAVQGLRDNELWRASEFNAIIGLDNSLTIQASYGYEQLTLKTANITPGTYQLGVNETSKATYRIAADGISEEYQTGTDIGNGEIIINAQDTDVSKGYITGTFRFNAEDENGDVVNFQNGVFYKVRITQVQ